MFIDSASASSSGGTMGTCTAPPPYVDVSSCMASPSDHHRPAFPSSRYLDNANRRGPVSASPSVVRGSARRNGSSGAFSSDSFFRFDLTSLMVSIINSTRDDDPIASAPPAAVTAELTSPSMCLSDTGSSDRSRAPAALSSARISSTATSSISATSFFTRS